jgi:hypothetical protein
METIHTPAYVSGCMFVYVCMYVCIYECVCVCVCVWWRGGKVDQNETQTPILKIHHCMQTTISRVQMNTCIGRTPPTRNSNAG